MSRSPAAEVQIFSAEAQAAPADAQVPSGGVQIPPPAAQTDAPVTLYRVMQEMIAEGLKTRYQPPPKLSHELFVLLMQINENDRRKSKAGGHARAAARA